MVEELASMQYYGTYFFIRRHDETIEDTETLFNNTHLYLQFKFRGMHISKKCLSFQKYSRYFQYLIYHVMVPDGQGRKLCLFPCDPY